MEIWRCEGKMEKWKVMKGVEYKDMWNCKYWCEECNNVWCIKFDVKFVDIKDDVNVYGNDCVNNYVINIGRREVKVII
jgi:hypothetical protein